MNSSYSSSLLYILVISLANDWTSRLTVVLTLHGGQCTTQQSHYTPAVLCASVQTLRHRSMATFQEGGAVGRIYIPASVPQHGLALVLHVTRRRTEERELALPAKVWRASSRDETIARIETK
jgi:hypothetical protein